MKSYDEVQIRPYVLLAILVVPLVVLLSPHALVSAENISVTAPQPVQVQRISEEEMIQRVARETGRSIEEVRQEREQWKREHQESAGSSGNSMNMGDFWAYIPNCTAGMKAVVLFDTTAGSGWVTFEGYPLHRGAWTCPSSFCSFYAATGTLLGPPYNQYVWAVSITGDVAIWTAYCRTNT